jgi:hypothetical protein
MYTPNDTVDSFLSMVVLVVLDLCCRRPRRLDGGVVRLLSVVTFAPDQPRGNQYRVVTVIICRWVSLTFFQNSIELHSICEGIGEKAKRA